MMVIPGQGPSQEPPDPVVTLTVRPVRNGFILVTSPPQKRGNIYIATNLEEALTMSATMLYTALKAYLRNSMHEHQFDAYTLEDFMEEITTLYTPKPPEDQEGARPI